MRKSIFLSLREANTYSLHISTTMIIMSQKIVARIPFLVAKSLFNSQNNVYKIPNFLQCFSRNLSSKKLTPAVTLMSNESTSHLKRQPDISEFSSDGRLLTVLFCWLAAKDSAVKKYANFYLDKGFDVLVFRVSPAKVILPKTIDPIVQNEIIPTLLTSNHQKKLIHGFSIGGYVFGRMLKYMHDDPTSRSQELVKTIKAQIWDSVVMINGVSIGVAKSIFLDSKFLQKSLQNYIDIHMRIFHGIATKYYDESQWYFINKSLKLPALFLGSEIDQISTIEKVQNDIIKVWENKGIGCSTKFWRDTQHVGHMHVHPKEYIETVSKFLDSVGFQNDAKCHDDCHLPLKFSQC